MGVLDLDVACCADTVAAIVAAGGGAIVLGANIAERGEVRAAVAQLRAASGPITILVNNAGVTDFTRYVTGQTIGLNGGRVVT